MLASAALGFENASYLWREGERRLNAATPDQRPVLEAVVARLVADLRRRLGGRFSVQELVDLYEAQGTSWCLELAVAVAPEAPWAWDTGVVGDAAFARYLREAVDFAGGRREHALDESAS